MLSYNNIDINENIFLLLADLQKESQDKNKLLKAAILKSAEELQVQYQNKIEKWQADTENLATAGATHKRGMDGGNTASVAAGSGLTGLGIVLLLVGIFATIVTAGAAAGLVAAGIGLIAGGVSVATSGIVGSQQDTMDQGKFSEAQNTVTEDQTKVSDLQGQIDREMKIKYSPIQEEDTSSQDTIRKYYEYFGQYSRFAA